LVAPVIADVFHTRALALRAGESVAASVSPQLSAIEWAPWLDVYVLALGDTYLELARTAGPGGGRPASFEELFSTFPSGREGLFEAARLAYERATRMTPLDPFVWLHLGRLHATWAEAERDTARRQSQLAEAAASLDRAIAQGPGRVRLLDEAAVVNFQLGRLEEATRLTMRAIEGDRRTSERVSRLGDIAHAGGAPAIARERYVEALRLDQRSGAAEIGLARLDWLAGNRMGAIERAHRATRLQMRNWRHYHELAIMLRDAERWDEALVAARSARRFAPAWEWDDLTMLVESVRR
jgi:tetratricopeptide (TPR) repeat protein